MNSSKEDPLQYIYNTVLYKNRTKQMSPSPTPLQNPSSPMPGIQGASGPYHDQHNSKPAMYSIPLHLDRKQLKATDDICMYASYGRYIVSSVGRENGEWKKAAGRKTGLLFSLQCWMTREMFLVVTRARCGAASYSVLSTRARKISSPDPPRLDRSRDFSSPGRVVVICNATMIAMVDPPVRERCGC